MTRYSMSYATSTTTTCNGLILWNIHVLLDQWPTPKPYMTTGLWHPLAIQALQGPR